MRWFVKELMNQIGGLVICLFLEFQEMDSKQKLDYQMTSFFLGSLLATGYARKKDLEGDDK